MQQEIVINYDKGRVWVNIRHCRMSNTRIYFYGKISDDGLYRLGSFILAENFTSGAKLVVEYVSIGYKALVIVLLHFKHKKIFYNPANS